MTNQVEQNHSPQIASGENLVPPQPQLPKKRFSIKKIFLIILFLISLVLIPIVIFYGSSYYSLFKVGYDNAHPLKVPEFKITELNKSDWKVFSGKYIGISFKYPSNWYEEEDKNVSQILFGKLSDEEKLKLHSNKKIVNLINVDLISEEVLPGEFDSAKKYYEYTKTLEKNEIVKDLEYDDMNLQKISEGKALDGKEYLTYLKYMWDYASITDPNAPEGKRIINSKALITYIFDKDSVYRLILSEYDDNGANIYMNLLNTIKISNEPLPKKKYENNLYSFEYPPYYDVNEKAWQNLPVPATDSRLSLGADNLDVPFIVIRNLYIDPNVYKDGSFLSDNTWWNRAVCAYIGPSFWFNGFSQSNGSFIVFKNADVDSGSGYEEYIVNKPYIVKIYSEEQITSKVIKEIALSMKFKLDKEKLDSELINYYQEKKDDEEVGLECKDSTFFIR